MRKRLEFVAGSSAKFWEIDVRGAEHTVTFGRLGTNGQSKTKAFADAAAAKADAEKLIASKLKKGYRAAKASTTRAPAKPAKTKAPRAASQDAVADAIAEEAGKTPVAKVERLDLKLPRGGTLEPLLGCKALRNLFLRAEPIPDLAVLAKLPRLTELGLSAKTPPTILGDATLPKLEDLTVYGRIGAPTYLGGLTGLQRLTLKANTASSDLKDLAPIAKLRTLRSLDISGAQVRSLRALAELRLEGVTIEHCKALRTLDGLERSAGLTYVNAMYAGLDDISALAGARKLGSLNLRGTSVSDLSAIRGAVEMTSLHVEKTKVTSLAALENMRKLEILWAWDIGVMDLTMLDGLTSLRILEVPTLKSPSWEFLATLKGVEQLDLMMCNVPEDVAGLLLGLPKLEKVRLAKTAVSRDDADVKKLDARLRKRKGGVSFDASKRWSWTM